MVISGSTASSQRSREVLYYHSGLSLRKKNCIDIPHVGRKKNTGRSTLYEGTLARGRKSWQRKAPSRVAEDFAAGDRKFSGDDSVKNLVPWAATKSQRRAV